MNGRPTALLRADYALRGVVLPAGISTVEFRYQSATVAFALRLAGVAIVIVLGWLVTRYSLDKTAAMKARGVA